MKVIIQQRHDTAARWTAANPTLMEGEIGIESDTDKFKFGDGVTAWNTLAYINTGSGGGGGSGSGAFESDPLGDGTSTVLLVTHGLGVEVVGVTVYNILGPFPINVSCGVQLIDPNSLNLAFTVAPLTNSIKCVVIG